MRLLPAILAAALLAVLPAPTQAGTGPCLPDGSGPRCHFWKFKVTDVNDGDTIGGDVLGDGHRKHEDVRFSGIQTMELIKYDPKRRTGECHAVGPTLQVEELIRRSDVVFATSSLEVGYDDPDITLVYQQYAPQNLASFIQRKALR